MEELTSFGKQYGFEYGGNFTNIDLVHFYGNEADYGYKNRSEAIQINDKYEREHENIPIYEYEEKNIDDEKYKEDN